MKDQRVTTYRKKAVRASVLSIVIAIVAVILGIVSLSIDSDLEIGISESLDIIRRHLDGIEPSNFIDHLKDKVVYSENLPRAIAALCAGSTLAVCGAALQSTIRNPLAEPYTLGISSGALFGMVIYVALGISVVPFLSDDYAQIANAFVLGLVPTAVIVLIALFKKVTPTMMILCGIGTMYIFAAMTTIIKYNVEPETLSQIYQWSIGSVSGQSIKSVSKLIFASILSLVSMMILAKRIDIVAQGDQNAKSLGIDPNRLRIICLILVSVSTATIVCYTGTIGFVGLVAPHIARILAGSRNRLLLPLSAAIGALMVIACDIILRLYFPNIPVGAVLAIICSPVFIALLFKMKKNTW